MRATRYKHHVYLLPEVADLVRQTGATKVFDLGCGRGDIAGILSESGIRFAGIDISDHDIAQANWAYPQIDVHVGSAYDDLAARFGRFPVVISLEVVEHLFEPRTFARRVFDLLEPGGTAIVSTPFHGYWKNLALAASGKLDGHFTALWDGGHIKFWSEATLRQLLAEAGFSEIRFRRVGRIPALAKSMIAIARRPA